MFLGFSSKLLYLAVDLSRHKFALFGHAIMKEIPLIIRKIYKNICKKLLQLFFTVRF